MTLSFFLGASTTVAWIASTNPTFDGWLIQDIPLHYCKWTPRWFTSLLSPTFGMHQYTADLAPGRGAGVRGACGDDGPAAARAAWRRGGAAHAGGAWDDGLWLRGGGPRRLGGCGGRSRRCAPTWCMGTGRICGTHCCWPWCAVRAFPTVHTLPDRPASRRCNGAPIRLWNALVTAASDRSGACRAHFGGVAGGRRGGGRFLLRGPLLHGLSSDAAYERRLDSSAPRGAGEPWRTLLWASWRRTGRGSAARCRGAAAVRQRSMLICWPVAAEPPGRARQAGTIHLAGYAGDALAWDLLELPGAGPAYTGATQSRCCGGLCLWQTGGGERQRRWPRAWWQG